jgi:hypothetical protein
MVARGHSEPEMAVRILLAAVSFFSLRGALTKVIVALVSTTVVLRRAYTEFVARVESTPPLTVVRTIAVQ